MKTQFTANAIFFIFYAATILRSVSSILNRFMYINGFAMPANFPTTEGDTVIVANRDKRRAVRKCKNNIAK